MPTASTIIDVSKLRRDLTNAVIMLTANHTVETKQRPPGGGWKRVTVTHGPLIRDLEHAVAGDLSGGNAVASSTTSLVINMDAVAKLAQLKLELDNSWNDLVPFSKPLTINIPLRKSLHIWHTMFDQQLSLPIGKERRLPFETTRWIGWVLQIQRMFDPERIIPFPDPCPVCGARDIDDLKFYGTTTKSGAFLDRRRAVNTHLREPFELSTAECSNPACRAVWDGPEGLALLAAGKPPHRPKTGTTPSSP